MSPDRKGGGSPLPAGFRLSVQLRDKLLASRATEEKRAGSDGSACPFMKTHIGHAATVKYLVNFLTSDVNLAPAEAL